MDPFPSIGTRVPAPGMPTGGPAAAPLTREAGLPSPPSPDAIRAVGEQAAWNAYTKSAQEFERAAAEARRQGAIAGAAKPITNTKDDGWNVDDAMRGILDAIAKAQPPPPPLSETTATELDAAKEHLSNASPADPSRLRSDIEQVRTSLGANTTEEQRAALGVCELCADCADCDGDVANSELLRQRGKEILDLATDFAPGVSLAKDLVSITTRINPVTKAPVGDVEVGLLAAGILFPGAVEGIAKSVGKAAKAIGAATLRNGSVKGLAHQFAQPLRKAEKFIAALVDNATGKVPFSSEETKRLAQAVDSGRDAVEMSARALRESPGKAVITKPLFDSEKLLNGTHGNAGLVPKEVGEKLSGREFKSFDEFRSEFWKTVADSKYGKDFLKFDMNNMAKGKAPFVDKSQVLGLRKVYELHHISPIQRGGSVYDVSNLAIVTPKFHKEVLDGIFHYGK